MNKLLAFLFAILILGMAMTQAIPVALNELRTIREVTFQVSFDFRHAYVATVFLDVYYLNESFSYHQSFKVPSLQGSCEWDVAIPQNVKEFSYHIFFLFRADEGYYNGYELSRTVTMPAPGKSLLIVIYAIG